MLLEPLKLKVNNKPILSADKAFRSFILLGIITLLSKLRKFIYNSPRKNFEDDLLCK